MWSIRRRERINELQLNPEHNRINIVCPNHSTQMDFIVSMLQQDFKHSNLHSRFVSYWIQRVHQNVPKDIVSLISSFIREHDTVMDVTLLMCNESNLSVWSHALRKMSHYVTVLLRTCSTENLLQWRPQQPMIWIMTQQSTLLISKPIMFRRIIQCEKGDYLSSQKLIGQSMIVACASYVPKSHNICLPDPRPAIREQGAYISTLGDLRYELKKLFYSVDAPLLILFAFPHMVLTYLHSYEPYRKCQILGSPYQVLDLISFGKREVHALVTEFPQVPILFPSETPPIVVATISRNLYIDEKYIKRFICTSVKTWFKFRVL